VPLGADQPVVLRAQGGAVTRTCEPFDHLVPSAFSHTAGTPNRT
jgi:hypothetical protein